MGKTLKEKTPTEQHEERAAAEEIRFAKQQQWYVTTAALTLIAAIYANNLKVSANFYEKAIASLLLATIVFLAYLFIVSLQNHLAAKRKTDRTFKNQIQKNQCNSK